MKVKLRRRSLSTGLSTGRKLSKQTQTVEEEISDDRQMPSIKTVMKNVQPIYRGSRSGENNQEDFGTVEKRRTLIKDGSKLFLKILS